MKQNDLTNTFIENCKDLFWTVNPNYDLVYANKSYLKLVEELTGAKKSLSESVPLDIFGEEYIEKWKKHYQDAFQGNVLEIENHYYHPQSNEIRFFYITFQPLLAEDNTVIGVACQSKDVTDFRKQQNEKNQMIDYSLDVFCTVNESGNFVNVSAAAEVLWGYLPEELIGKPYTDLVLEEDASKTIAIAELIMKGTNVRSFVNRYKKKEGGIAYNIWSVTWDATNKLTYCVARDGKEKIEEEEIIKQSEQRFRALVQEGSDLIALFDLEAKYIYVSPTSIPFFGINPEFLIGKNALDFVHPDDTSMIMEYLKKITTNKIVYIEPFRFQNQQKEWRWLETVLTNMLDNPAVRGIVSNSRDITDKVAERQRLKLLESVVTNTRDSVVITEVGSFDNPSSKIIFVNEAFTKMTGYTADEVLGKTPRILQGKNSDKDELVKLGRAMRNWQHYETTLINYKKCGEEYWVNFAVTPVANEKGIYTHWIAIERDVTEQKKVSLQLNKLNQSLQKYSTDLKRSNGELEQFAFVASHDLQEPLRMISSFMDLLKRKYGDVIDEKGHQYIHYATDGAKRMKQIILDLLEFSRAGKPLASMGQVDINDVLSEFMHLRRQVISEKKAIITTRPMPIITNHRAAITQIFHCILDNALKYCTLEKAPNIAIDAEESALEWKFAIKDNGIGIATQFHEKIFIIFQRLHNKEDYSGTGIGLSVAKRHIEFLGGRIWLDSTPEKGSTFYFIIPKIKSNE
jgi:PAS domain S-box-containing protein